MYKLKYAEFFITNVCNLSCENCNRFSNYNFKGTWDWQPNLYEPWSKKLDLDLLCIMGGEPTLNPHLTKWIEGLSKLWPKAQKILKTNGTRLQFFEYPKFTNLLKKYNWLIEVSLHSSLKSKITKDILSNLHRYFGPIKFDLELDKKNVFKARWDIPGITKDNIFADKIRLLSPSGLRIDIRSKWKFVKNSFKDPINMEFHNSNPELAHKLCVNKICHTFIDGKLYKCGAVALLPNLLKQFNKPIPTELSSYLPLSIDNVTQESLYNLSNNKIDACRLCSDKEEDWQTFPIESLQKKFFKGEFNGK